MVDSPSPRSNPNEPEPGRALQVSASEMAPTARASWTDAPPAGGEGPQLHRYVAALRRYKWMIMGLTVLGFGGGVAASRFVPPIYTAQATIWVEPSSGDDRGPIRQGQLLGGSGWNDLLKSFTVLDYAVREMKLYLQYRAGQEALFNTFGLRERFRPGDYRVTLDKNAGQVTLATADGLVLEQVAPGDSIGKTVGFAWAPSRALLVAGRRVEFSVSTPRDAALALRSQLRVSTDARTNFLRVDLEGTSPERIAKSVNTITERFVMIADQLKREKLTELARILGDQLRQAERNLRESEGDLQRFRVQTITLPSDRATPVTPGLAITQDPVYGGFFNQKIEAEQVRRDREAIERALTEVGDSGISVGALESIGTVQHSSELMAALKELTDKHAELRALRNRYLDEYPPVQQLIAVIGNLENQAIPAIARGVMAQLATRERELNGRITSASRELQQIPPRAIEEARLQRDVNIASTLYTTLQQRYEEARLAEASSIPDVRILDAAVVPEQAVKNQAYRLMMLGLVGGMGLGVLGAVMLDRFDKRVRYPEQVTQLGLPILGVVPHFQAGNGAGGAAQPVIEAMRGIRLNLRHAYGSSGALLVTITSPGPGDGKSFVASNLALSFADAGLRTLLIDGDNRRGALHRVFRVNRKPGLVDVLSGRLGHEDVLLPTDNRLLQFMGSGTRLQNAPELLGSAGMVQLLTALRSTYAVIIVDSPPLGAGVDAFALGTATGNIVLVLRTGSTDREMAEAKLEVLDRLPVRILGAVMNGVKDWGAYRYYSYYLDGYDLEEEDAAGRKKLVGGAS